LILKLNKLFLEFSQQSKSINCIDFLPDHSLLTGDTNGALTIWAPLESESGTLEFVVKEVRGHEVK
jgi:hypothetical protein